MHFKRFLEINDKENNKLKNELSETKKYLEEILIKFKEINKRN